MGSSIVGSAGGWFWLHGGWGAIVALPSYFHYLEYFSGLYHTRESALIFKVKENHMSNLFVYGTLGPGRPNAHILENIGGQWSEGWVNGSLRNEGWGADLGYPGIVLDDSSNQVQGFVFSSEQLDANWKLLDDFEGEGYESTCASHFK